MSLPSFSQVRIVAGVTPASLATWPMGRAGFVGEVLLSLIEKTIGIDTDPVKEVNRRVVGIDTY